ncbi:hypothetical protein A4X13_0g8949, partial [Tilletia indica]
HWRRFDPAVPVDLDCYCDGSTSYGVGLSIQGRERAYPLRDDLKGRTDIKIVEALALELALLTVIALGHTDCTLLIHTDNTAVLGAFKKGKMASEEPNKVIQRVAKHEQRARIAVQLEWVDTLNQRADAASRGKSTSNLPRLPTCAMEPDLAQWFDDSW